MKFFTNRIPTGEAKSFDDLIREHQAKQAGQQKQASSATSVKTAEAKASEPDEAESSGQLDVEPLHQKGESTPSPGKKEDKEASGDVKDTDNENAQGAEGDDSGQPKAEEKCHNDPEAGKHRDGDGDQKQAEAEGETKKAESKEAAGLDNFGDKKAEPFGKKDDGGEDKPAKKEDDDKEASDKSETKKAACDCGCEDCVCKGGSKACKKCGCEAKAETETKEAAGTKFYKIADLNDKSKSKFKEYWKQLWPADFVDAVSADK